MGTNNSPKWKMINITPGYIIYEDCYRTRKYRSYFSKEPVEIVEEYVEGEHRWKYTGSAQSIQFDLQNTETGEIVQMRELMGLMLCTGCNEECSIYPIEEMGTAQNIWVYLAISYDSPKTKQDQLDQRKLEILNDYFNSRIISPGKKILIIPQKLSLPPSLCYGEIIKDEGLTDLEKQQK